MHACSNKKIGPLQSQGSSPYPYPPLHIIRFQEFVLRSKHSNQLLKHVHKRSMPRYRKCHIRRVGHMALLLSTEAVTNLCKVIPQKVNQLHISGRNNYIGDQETNDGHKAAVYFSYRRIFQGRIIHMHHPVSIF